MVYSARSGPSKRMVCTAGCSMSFEMTDPVASGQFISNFPRLTAVWIACGSSFCMYSAFEGHPARADNATAEKAKHLVEITVSPCLIIRVGRPFVEPGQRIYTCRMSHPTGL